MVCNTWNIGHGDQVEDWTKESSAAAMWKNDMKDTPIFCPKWSGTGHSVLESQPLSRGSAAVGEAVVVRVQGGRTCSRIAWPVPTQATPEEMHTSSFGWVGS